MNLKVLSSPGVLAYLGTMAYASNKITGAPMLKSAVVGAGTGLLGAGLGFGLAMSGKVGTAGAVAAAVAPTVLGAKLFTGASWKQSLMLGGVAVAAFLVINQASKATGGAINRPLIS